MLSVDSTGCCHGDESNTLNVNYTLKRIHDKLHKLIAMTTQPVESISEIQCLATISWHLAVVSDRLRIHGQTLCHRCIVLYKSRVMGFPTG